MPAACPFLIQAAVHSCRRQQLRVGGQSRDSLSAKVRARTQVSPSVICGGKGGTVPSFRFSPLTLIPPMFNIHSFIHSSLTSHKSLQVTAFQITQL